MNLPFPPPHPIYVSCWQHGIGNIVFPSCCQVVFYIFSYVIFCSSLVHFVVNVFNVFNGCVIYFIDKKKVDKALLGSLMPNAPSSNLSCSHSNTSIHRNSIFHVKM